MNGKDGKKYAYCPGYNYFTGSRVVHKSACLVHSVIVTPDGTNASYATLYEGIDTTSPVIAVLRVVGTTSEHFKFNPPLVLNRGLYVAFETNLQAVTTITS